IALSVLLAAALAVIVILVETRNKPEVGAAAYVETSPAVFRTFWGGFLSSPEEPWVIFSNGAFVGRPETGMRYFDAARDSRDLILDHYTGVGEVLAVHDLDRVFASLHRQIRVKRGSLFSLDDAKNNDLFFVGWPSEGFADRRDEAVRGCAASEGDEGSSGGIQHRGATQRFMKCYGVLVWRRGSSWAARWNSCLASSFSPFLRSASAR